MNKKQYSSVPSVKKVIKSKTSQNNSLNLDLKSPLNHSKKESTLVRVLTTSVIGEPKMLHVWSAI